MAEDVDKYQRVEEDDPLRCQAVTANGQCRIKAIDGSKYCPVHAGGGNAAKAKEATRNFRLTMWQARVGDFADNDGVKSLREEIGILRMLLEETLNRCKDPTELILYSNKISDLVMKVDKVVTSCHRLESATGQLLDKQAALNIASVIVAIVAKHVTDEDAMEAVANEIIAAIVNANTEKKETK